MYLRSVQHDLTRPVLHPLRPVDLQVVVDPKHHLLPHTSAHHVAHLGLGCLEKRRPGQTKRRVASINNQTGLGSLELVDQNQ